MKPQNITELENREKESLNTFEKESPIFLEPKEFIIREFDSEGTNGDCVQTLKYKK